MKHSRFLGRLFVTPRLQLGVTAWFLAVALLSLLFQFLQFSFALAGSSEKPIEDTAAVFRGLGDAALEALLTSTALVLPLTLAVGLLATFRIAGPAHRLEVYLRRVRDGEALPDCTLRKGDEFEGLCELINDVTREQRERNGGAAERREVA